jgi:Uncharacterised nucleotidyltransferase
MADPPLETLTEEVARVLEAAEREGVTVRAVGGLAVHLVCPSARTPPLARSYKDLDLVGRRGDARPITDLLTSLGYQPAAEFNALHGHRQLYFWDPANGRQLDVFVERINLSHELDVGDRLELAPKTLTPADLLLTKLQVVEINDRDLRDATALLVDQPVGPDGIDPGRVVEVLSSDWGWWRTCTGNLDAVAAFANELEAFGGKGRVRRGVQELRRHIDEAPKTVRWKLRSILGERVRWYELPEETGA